MQQCMDFAVALAGGVIELKSIRARVVFCDAGSYDFVDLVIRHWGRCFYSFMSDFGRQNFSRAKKAFQTLKKGIK